MSQQTQSVPVATGDGSPAVWIGVGMFCVACGWFLTALATGGVGVLDAIGLALVGLGGIPILVGTIALGVELGIARSRR